MTRSADGYRYLRVDGDNLRHELYVTAVGSLDHAAGRPYPAPGHPDGYSFDWSRGRVLGDFALVFLSRGAGIFETRAGRARYGAGDALLIPPGVWHRYRPDPARGWREHWICANGEFLHRLRAKRRFVTDAVLLPGVAGLRLRDAHRRLWTEVVRREPSNDLALAAAALEVFALALRTPSRRAAPAADAPEMGDRVALAAREYIAFNSHRVLTVNLIARHVGVSRRTLERRFLRHHGTTLAGEVMTHRVERARQLLTETRMSVKEISYTVGFGDARRLIRNFSRTVGLTPAAFRRREEAADSG